ncbi:MAG: penicillin-binding protein activator [Hyphomicrobiaceae bacterium]
MPPTGAAHSVPGTYRSLAAAVLAATALLAGCVSAGPEIPGAHADGSDPAAAKRKPTKVVMLLPLSMTGQTAAVAKGLKQAGELALFDRDNPSVQLIVKDDKGTPEGAAAAAEDAVKEGAELILGPLFAPSVEAAGPVARRAGIPVIAFSNDRRVAGNGIYLFGFFAEPEIERIVAFAAARGSARYAAMIPDDEHGKTTEEIFRDAVARAGGEVVLVVPYGAHASRMLEPTKRLVEGVRGFDTAGQPVDTVFLPGGPHNLPSLGPLLSYANMDTRKIKPIGTGTWDYPTIGRETAFVGGWFPAPDPRGWSEFAPRFAKTYGTSPPRIASLAYDAVSIAIVLSTGPQGARFAAANLTRPAGFTGVDGPVRLHANGIAERGLAVLEVHKLGPRVVDPVPGTFGSAQTSAGPRRLR